MELERDGLLGETAQPGRAEGDGGRGLEKGAALDHERVSVKNVLT
jgi:hypothetical protein